ncbi:MAG TPA: sigma-54 dependent transcriptional regulator, partial [Thermoanaerobaculia bacterium]|nr:sigma-54 dependent transcriptional regulator [Thermoanaerobaculia bacterium]
LRELDPTLPVVVMTAWASVDVAVEAMRRGARDFVEKPWDNARLLSILATQAELARALRKGERLEAENRILRGEAAGRLVANAPSMRPVVDLVERIGPSEANVLLTGEHGTGKSLVARILHELSARSGNPLVTVNTGALSDTVFESELFGHVRGAFTDAKDDRVGRFELADGGTLFLDEIANITAPQQAKLLRVVETGELERVGSSRTRTVDVRILSATNAELESEVAEGRFRQDLLFRLNTVTVHIPPLRERREDVPALAARFLERHARRYRKELAGFEEGAMKALLEYRWPGNVRELDHTVERGVLMARGERIAEEDLFPGRGAGGPLGRGSGSGGPRKLDEMTLEEAERVMIRRALERTDGSVTEAARALGLSRSALYRRLEKYDLE